jgi:hypothetical protein
MSNLTEPGLQEVPGTVVPDLPNANKVYLLIFDILKNAKN